VSVSVSVEKASCEKTLEKDRFEYGNWHVVDAELFGYCLIRVIMASNV
jgi:hypothetical protein